MINEHPNITRQFRDHTVRDGKQEGMTLCLRNCTKCGMKKSPQGGKFKLGIKRKYFTCGACNVVVSG